MKSFIYLLIFPTVGLLVFALIGLASDEGSSTYTLLPVTCSGTVICGLLFLILTARQSRKDQEARKDALRRDMYRMYRKTRRQ